jgi:hypothetical protein
MKSDASLGRSSAMPAYLRFVEQGRTEEKEENKIILFLFFHPPISILFTLNKFPCGGDVAVGKMSPTAISVENCIHC